MSRDDYKKRTITIAKGEYIPKINEPKVWFESSKAIFHMLDTKSNLTFITNSVSILKKSETV